MVGQPCAPWKGHLDLAQPDIVDLDAGRQSVRGDPAALARRKARWRRDYTARHRWQRWRQSLVETLLLGIIGLPMVLFLLLVVTGMVAGIGRAAGWW